MFCIPYDKSELLEGKYLAYVLNNEIVYVDTADVIDMQKYNPQAKIVSLSSNRFVVSVSGYYLNKFKLKMAKAGLPLRQVEKCGIDHYITYVPKEIIGLNRYEYIYYFFSGEEFDFQYVPNLDKNHIFSYLLVGFYILICLILYVIVFARLESSKWQGTPGKIFVGLKVIDTDGKRISYDKACMRGIFRIVSMLILFIGYIFILLKDHRTLHDIWSKTYVVDK